MTKTKKALNKVPNNCPACERITRSKVRYKICICGHLFVKETDIETVGVGDHQHVCKEKK